MSPEYLQRHSRQTRLKDMAPLARGTSAREVAKRIEEEGANAAAVARVLAMMESFMVVDGWMDGWMDGWIVLRELCSTTAEARCSVFV